MRRQGRQHDIAARESDQVISIKGVQVEGTFATLNFGLKILEEAFDAVNLNTQFLHQRS